MMRSVNRLTRCRRLISRVALVAGLSLAGLFAPASALAQDEPEIATDARLEGFDGNVKVENESTALSWLFFIFLAVVGLSPLFKDAKRTHLD
jgi:hypothetical protein